MGRHRRSGAAPAAEDYAAGPDSPHRGAARRRRPVRTGLLGASAALAVGAVAVASGLLPGGDTFTVGNAGTSEHKVQTRQAPELTTQGGSTQSPAGGSDGAVTGTGAGKNSAPASPSATPSTKPSPKATPKPKPKATPSKTPSKTPPRTKAPVPKPVAPKSSAAPTTKAPAPRPAPTTAAPEKPPVASTADRGEAAEAEVFRLVNAERAKVGCTPVRADARLAALAGAFSADMATRGFFDHTDPDGDTPWVRAEQAGISGMGGENIARGQVDAAAVMASWMNSDGHRANIMNCDFTTMGVGVVFGDGGPWWTQDFGY
ncbi:CAP domain-containing protein [Streptomyces globisporus]|uniref:CAP domain-containing protein n=1 Tax=Streptomyces globisporus TaxID=1908 RepID=UPI0004CC75ED|nr:CAP domain-containing protein [Streptomyces globisporus]